MNYFKVYQSQFENKSYVAEMTDLEKVLHMFIQSEFNKHQAKATKKNKKPIMAFSHYWLSASLSSHRRNISRAIKNILTQGNYFDYKRGYSTSKKSAPSIITDVQQEKFYIEVDRYTFESLLLDKLKNKEIKYKHIVAYAVCKYIQQFQNGSATVNEFGHLLGLTVESVNYSRIKPILEKLEELKLITFDKKHGNIENIQVMTYKLDRLKQNKLREDITIESNEIHLKEKGIAHKEISASVEDLPEPQNFEEIITLVKDIYAKRTGKKAKTLKESNRRKILSSNFSHSQIYEIITDYFEKIGTTTLINMNGEIFNHIANYIQKKALERYL